jgi:hypothetical protein
MYFQGSKRLLFALAIGFAGAVQSTEGLATDRYVDAVDYSGHEQGWDTFYDLEARLFRGFDDVCGDTFCEGEYSNIQPLRYRCSVERATGIMGECAWAFAASNQAIEPSNGRIAVEVPVWHCRTPLAPGTRIEDFYRALDVRNAIHARLPGSRQSIYEGLTDCL